jgi:murein L,D-transpeptidase YcbB/YkuD
MNPELEARLRRFGASVDAAADAAAARRASGPLRSPLSSAGVSHLEPVDEASRRRQPRFYRVLAGAAAAAAAAIAVGVVVARTGSPEGSGNLAAGNASPVVESTAAPSTSTAPSTTAAPATTTAAPSTSTSTSTTPSATSAPSSVACPSYRLNDTLPLRLCDKGEAVNAVQQRLGETVAPGLLVDGYFGPSTRAAVRTFQREHGLEVDGLVGSNTWSALFGSVAETSPEAAVPG